MIIMPDLVTNCLRISGIPLRRFHEQVYWNQVCHNAHNVHYIYFTTTDLWFVSLLLNRNEVETSRLNLPVLASILILYCVILFSLLFISLWDNLPLQLWVKYLCIRISLSDAHKLGELIVFNLVIHWWQHLLPSCNAPKWTENNIRICLILKLLWLASWLEPWRQFTWK